MNTLVLFACLVFVCALLWFVRWVALKAAYAERGKSIENSLEAAKKRENTNAEVDASSDAHIRNELSEWVPEDGK